MVWVLAMDKRKA